LNLLRQVIASDPNAIQRRLSRFEQEQSVLHYVIAPPDGLVGGLFRTGDHYRTLELLIELGADIEARDAKGRTPLALAMLRGDWEAMRRLSVAGAIVPKPEGQSPAPAAPTFAVLSAAISKQTPMLSVPDVAATVAWYRAVGFELVGSHGDEGKLGWACVRLGSAEVMFVPSSDPWRSRVSGVSLWFRTDRIDDLYAHFRRRQLARARAVLAGEASDAPDVRITVDLYTAFYGQREFGIRDPNDVELMFAQSTRDEGSS
jgi:catechol 2,3-dioxygenase-like lactoylglutathione lyase family enzyme